MTIKINPVKPEEHLLQKAAEIVRSGGVIAFPTDTSYGLGVNPYDDEAVCKVYRLKGRGENKPLILLISNKEQLEGLVEEISPLADKLIENFWPGPLTLIFKASDRLKRFKIGSFNSIAVRMPDSLLARKLIETAQSPLTATSANPSGKPSPFSAETVREYFDTKLVLIIDGGAGRQGCDSTIVDVTVDPPRLVRAGAISPDKLKVVVPNLLM